MFTVTLIASAKGSGLDAALLDSLRNAWGGGTANWLAKGEAASFQMLANPAEIETVWADLQALNVDLIVQEGHTSAKALLLADMDSTMIQQECIDELAVFAGVGDAVADITRRAMNGELDFDAALRERVGLLKDLPVQAIDDVMRERISFMPGGATLLATMKAAGATSALVSGGFTDFTARVSTALGFDYNRANRLLQADGVLTGEVGVPILGQAAKVEALETLTADLGITPDQVLAVGDGSNDLGMLNRAGLGVALHAKPVVQAQAKARVNFGDLTALLYLQGYSRDMFVERPDPN